MIEVKGLTKKYGEHYAVKDLSFKVEKGQIYGFLGPNGAGKSTTMNIMAGCLGATDGKVMINGYDIYEEPVKAKQSIGYLPEQPPLYMDMTPYEYLDFVAQAKGIGGKTRKQQIKDIMQTTKIDDVANRLIKHLSKGYKQRVGIAQAMVGYPEVIILDEPTVGLDPQQLIEIRALIKNLGKNHTVILSSHILQEISAVCDHILIISDGRLVASDTPEHLAETFNKDVPLQIKVRGSKNAVIDTLRSIAEPGSYRVSAPDSEGVVNILIDGECGNDMRANICFAFSKADMPILEMIKNTVSLEDIFLKITAGLHIIENTQIAEEMTETEDNLQ